MEKSESKEARLARLQEELHDMKGTLPEHCFGREGHIAVHRATPAHWQKIEDLEDEIKQLKSELAGNAR